MSLQFLENALQNQNVKAFLLTIRQSEGTDAPDGYQYLFGSSPHNNLRFTSFAQHPNIRETFNGITSSASGAYQILYRTWIAIQQKYNLPDFSPPNQDIAAVELISEENCFQKLIDGAFNDVIEGCSHIWASLPSAVYGQPTHSLEVVTNWYTQNGGTIVT